MSYFNPFLLSATRARRVKPVNLSGDTEEEELRKRLEELRNSSIQPTVPQQRQSILSRLLSAIPQALAVGISDNPGVALQQQFERQSREQSEKIQIEENRRRESERTKREVDMFDIQQRIESLKEKRQLEQRQIEKESERKFTREERIAEQEFKQKETGEQRSFLDKQNEKNYRQEVEKLHLNTDAQIQIDNARAESKKKGDALELSLVLIRNKVDPNTANTIASKMVSGEKLDKNENKLVGNALKPKVSVGGRGGSGGVKFKDVLDYHEAELRAFQSGYNAIDKIPLSGADGRPVLDVSGQPTFRVATDDERIQAGLKSREQFRLATSDIRQVLSGTPVKEVNKAGVSKDSSTKDAQINNMLRAVNDSVVSNGLDNTLKAIDNDAGLTPALKKQAKAKARQTASLLKPR